MTKLIAILTLAVVMTAGITANAQNAFADSGSGTTNFAVIPQGAGTPVVTYLNATGTNAANTVKFYYSTLKTSATAVNTTTSCPVARTNGFAAGDVVVLQHQGLDGHVAFERLNISSLGSPSKLVFAVAPATAVAAGDVFWQQTVAGTIPTGNATISLVGDGIVSGSPSVPLLLDCSAVGVTINAVNATYK